MTEPLPGGYVSEVTRVGDTVRRPQSARADYVHRLLEYLEQRGWPGAPRFMGLDDQGREILSFLEGHVAWAADQPAEIWSEDSLAAVGRLVRGFHDLTAGTELAGDADVVCHNDLSPKNTVYRDDGASYRPIAFIDWDLAAPGARLHDVAHICWQFSDLRPGRSDVSDVAHRMRVLCDGYGLVDRSEVIETVLWWQDRCWRGIEAQADRGVEAMVRLRDQGGSREVRAAYEWVQENRVTLEKGLDQG